VVDLKICVGKGTKVKVEINRGQKKWVLMVEKKTCMSLIRKKEKGKERVPNRRCHRRFA